MGTTGEAFGLSLGLYAILTVVLVLFFGVFRRLAWTQKFYAPKRHMKGVKKRPQRLPRPFWGWIKPVYHYNQEEFIELAGMDAAMYMRVLAFGAELFLYLTLLCCIVVLPTNLSGHEVERIMRKQSNTFTAWLSKHTFTGLADASHSLLHDRQTPTASFYNGMLANSLMSEPLSKNSSGAGGAYQFSDLDKTTLANISDRNWRLWVHLVVVWAVSIIVYRLLWRYNKEALALRIRYLMHARPGAQGHTVLTLDIPGVQYGTIRQRLQETVFRCLPASLQAKLDRAAVGTAKATAKTVEATVGQMADRVLPPFDASSATRPRGPQLAPVEASEDPPGEPLSPSEHTELLQTSEGPTETGRVEVDQLPSPIPPTELDAWPKAERLLAAGLTLHQMVEREFNELYPEQVASVHCVRDTRALDPLVREYQTVERQLEDLLDDYIAQKRRRRSRIKRRTMTVVPVRYGAWGLHRYGTKPRKVDTLQFYMDRLQALWELMQEQQRAARNKYWPTAFVTFRKRETQVLASTTMMHHDQRAWHVSAAPGPDEVVWENLGWRMWERMLRTSVVWTVFTLLCIFYEIPVGAVQALLQVNRLNHVPILKDLIKIPVVNSLLTAVLPGLTLRIFVAVLPVVLWWLNTREGLVSKSQIDFSVCQRYYIFQVVTVFFGSFIAGSVFNQVEALVHDPTSAITILGTSAPQTANFFMSYIALQALVTRPILFLRIPQLIMFWLATRWSATERAKARLWQHQVFTYGDQIPSHTIIILLGLVFSVAAPVICPLALMYFLVSSLLDKYNLVYVFTADYQSGGKVWKQVFNQVIAALVIFQLMMIGLFGVKRAPVQSVLCVALPIITLLFMRVSHALFDRPLELLSVRAAVDLDEFDKVKGRDLVQSSDETQYLAPAFKLSQDELDSLLYEAGQVDAMLKGERADDLEAAQAAEEGDDDDDYSSGGEVFYTARSGPLPASVQASAGSASSTQATLHETLLPSRQPNGGSSGHEIV